MPIPKRPRDPNPRAKLIVDMAIGEVPNDKDEILNKSGRVRSAEARITSQTPERRPEIARKPVAARWDR